MLVRNFVKRGVVALAIASSALLATRAHAQVQADQVQGGGGFTLPDLAPEDLEYFQQMQQFGQQMFQNIQDSGVDPQELFGNIGQQMQDGTFDPEAMQQMMIDKGIITPDMINQMQGSTRKYSLVSVRRELGSTDEEWAILEAKITRVLSALGDLNLNQQSAMMMNAGNRAGMMAPPSQNTDAAKAYKALKDVLKQPNASEAMVASKLQAWHDAYAKAKAELNTAQEELIKVVTLRQEAVLISVGIL